VEQHVAVAMANQLLIVRHIDAAQPQRSARFRAMTVLSKTNPQLGRDDVSRWGGPLVNC
jgi:hypothetical protein